jgi:urea transport system ATP-binding protein
MTPDLFDEGSERLQAHQFRRVQRPASGDREASYGHVLQAGELDLTHGRILYLEDVNVSFDGFKAINGLSLDIAPGELRCIIGPNGAGKTTMMDIITGKTRPDSGQVFFGSTIDLLRHNEPEALRSSGIGRKFQKPTVFEHLSVWENLELALATAKMWRLPCCFRLNGVPNKTVCAKCWKPSV